MRLQLYLILFLILLNGLECQDASNYQTGQILNQKMEENGVVGRVYFILFEILYRNSVQEKKKFTKKSKKLFEAKGAGFERWI